MNKIFCIFLICNFLIVPAFCQNNDELIKKAMDKLFRQTRPQSSIGPKNIHSPEYTPKNPIVDFKSKKQQDSLLLPINQNESNSVHKEVNIGSRNHITGQQLIIGNENRVTYSYNPVTESRKKIFAAPELKPSRSASIGSSMNGRNEGTIQFYLISSGAQGRILSIEDTVSGANRKFELLIAEKEEYDYESHFAEYSHRSNFDSGNILYFYVFYNTEQENPRKLAFDIIMADVDGNIYQQRVRARNIRANSHYISGYGSSNLMYFIPSPVKPGYLKNDKSIIPNSKPNSKSGNHSKTSAINQSVKIGDENIISGQVVSIGNGNVITYSDSLIVERRKLFSIPTLQCHFAAEHADWNGEQLVEFYLTSAGAPGRIIAIQDTIAKNKYRYELKIADKESYDYRNDMKKFSNTVNFKSGSNLHFILYFPREEKYSTLAFDIIMTDVAGNIYKQRLRTYTEGKGYYTNLFLKASNPEGIQH